MAREQRVTICRTTRWEPQGCCQSGRVTDRMITSLERLSDIAGMSNPIQTCSILVTKVHIIFVFLFAHGRFHDSCAHGQQSYSTVLAFPFSKPERLRELPLWMPLWRRRPTSAHHVVATLVEGVAHHDL